MFFTSIITNYVRWHYTKAFSELFHVWLNFLWFIIRYFSIPQLFGSLFAPWRRMTESKQRGWNFEAMAGYVIINLLSRIIGAIMRGSVIILGLLALTLAIVSGLCTFTFWVVAPIISVGSIFLGISFLLTSLTL